MRQRTIENVAATMAANITSSRTDARAEVMPRPLFDTTLRMTVTPQLAAVVTAAWADARRILNSPSPARGSGAA